MRIGVKSGLITPVFCGSALNLQALDMLLYNMEKLLPSPHLEAFAAEDKDGNPVKLPCEPGDTTAVLVFKPVPDPNAPAGSRKKRMPLGVVMDERIATGIEYSRFFAAFERYLKKPELLETRLDGQAVPAMA